MYCTGTLLFLMSHSFTSPSWVEARYLPLTLFHSTLAAPCTACKPALGRRRSRMSHR